MFDAVYIFILNTFVTLVLTIGKGFGMDKRRSANVGTVKNNMFDERKLERVAKGFANAQRIRILLLLESNPELSLGDICERLRLDYTNGCEHIKKLAIAGLVIKRRQKQAVFHKITNRGQESLSYLRSIR